MPSFRDRWRMIFARQKPPTRTEATTQAAPAQPLHIAQGMAGQVVESPGLAKVIAATEAATLSYLCTLCRPDDLLTLEVFSQNLVVAVDAQKMPHLDVFDPTQTAYLTFFFPPQSFGEQAILGSASAATPPAQMRAGIATQTLDGRPAIGTTRLCFALPSTGTPFSVAGLLDWANPGWHLVVNPLAASSPRGAPPTIGLTTFAPLETGIEMPYRMIISPTEAMHWNVKAQAAFVPPNTGTGHSAVETSLVTEVWHARLGFLPETVASSGPVAFAGAINAQPAAMSLMTVVPAGMIESNMRAVGNPLVMEFAPAQDVTADQPTTMRAIGWRDGPPSDIWSDSTTQDTKPQILPTRQNRQDIVKNSAGVQGTPFTVDHLYLSSLGGWMHAMGAWSNPGTSVSAWQHIISQGRDQYVYVVEEGVLFPFGHRAAKITITHRAFHPEEQDGQASAYLEEIGFYIVRQPVVSYDSYGLDAVTKRQLPFASVQVMTLRTPNDVRIDFIENNPTWPTYSFAFKAVDIAGNHVSFSMPQWFISKGDLTNASAAITAVDLADLTVGTNPPLTVNFGGQRIAFAPANAANPGHTTLVTQSITFAAMKYQNSAIMANFVPFVLSAQVQVPAISHLAGASTSQMFTYYDDYIAKGGAVFGKFAQGVGLALPKNRCGVLAPALSAVGLSSVDGPIFGQGDKIPDALAAAVNRQFDPSSLVPRGLQLLGIVDLADALALPNAAPTLDHAPKVSTVTIPPSGNSLGSITTKIHWETPIKDTDIFHSTTGDPIHLTLDGTIVTQKDNQQQSFIGNVSGFALDIADVIRINFEGLEFQSGSGKKTNVAVHLDKSTPITFKGNLDFVNQLASAIPASLFGDSGPAVETTADHVGISYTLPLPPIDIGIINIANAVLSAGVVLPYTNDGPVVDFAIASADHPFTVLVEALGGSGYLHLQLAGHSVTAIDGSLAFSGGFSLDVGVASGSVQIDAGVAFAFASGVSQVTGFVRASGEVSVLDIASLSITFDIEMTYQNYNKISGTAEVSVSVHIAFFSKSISFSVQRTFGGSGDPSFGDVFSGDTWGTYIDAFAA